MKVSLKAARVNAGFTQSEAAKKIGVSVSTIKNWESGVSFPKQPMIEKMCVLYGVPYDYINFFASKLA